MVLTMKAKFRYILTIVSFFLIYFFILRCTFFFLYSGQAKDLTLHGILKAFLIGIRFDIATIFILFISFWSFFLLPITKKYYYIVLHNLSYLALYITILISITDLIYFESSHKRLSFEIKIYFQNFFDINYMTWTQYTGITITSYIIIFLVFILWYFLFKKYLNTMFKITSSYITSFLSLFFFILISIVCIRGGLQSRSLKPTMAFQDNNTFLGSLALNPIYTVITALYKGDKYPIYNHEASKNQKVLHNLLKTPTTEFINTEYPFYRKTQPQEHSIKKNIVILVMESWGYKDLGRSGNSVSPTPFFDQLSTKGYFFSNHYSSGLRTLPMLAAIINSIPSVQGIFYSNSSYQFNHQRSLPTILKENGYETIFMYAAKDGSMGFSPYATFSGFNKVITKNDFNTNDVETDGVWGVYDEYALERLHKELQIYSKENPVFAMFMSLHPHTPFTQPKHWNQKIKDDFYNDMNYTDSVLEKFFTTAEKSDYFKNTIFIIVGDHAYGSNKHGVELFHTPLLIYAPHLLKGKIIPTVVSHLNIAPTIIDLLSIKTKYSFMGSSVFNSSSSFAMVDFDNYTGWIENNLVALFLQNKAIGIYDYKKDVLLKENLQNRYKHEMEDFYEKYIGYISAIGSSISNDKVVPNQP